MSAWSDLSRLQKVEIAVSGAFGGAAPILVGMAHELVRKVPNSMAFDPVSWVACGIMALVGTGVVWFYRESQTQKAVALGASAPALVLGFAMGTEGEAQRAWNDLIGPRPAYAQQASSRQLDSVWVRIPPVQGRSAASPVRVSLVPAAGAVPAAHRPDPRLIVQQFRTSPSEFQLLVLPAGVDSFEVAVGRETSRRYAVSALRAARTDSVSLIVTPLAPTATSRFLRTWGFRNTSRETISVRVASGSGGP